MSVFQRRRPAAAAPPPEGIRPASYSAPVPLMSTGVAALDDILCGGGILAGSLLAFVPCAGTGTAAPALLGAPAVDEAAHAAWDAMQVAAAEPYTDLFLAYTAAQGLDSGHVTVVIGPNPDAFVQGLMRRADGGAPPEREEKSEEELQRLKIAWRYDRMQRVDAPFQGDDAAAFCTVFDLTQRVPKDVLEDARASGLLHTCALDSTPMDAAWCAVEQGVAQCKAALEQGGRTPALRIILRDVGAPVWHQQGASLIPFLLRLRSLARTLSMPTSGTAIPCIVAMAAAASTQGEETGGANTLHRIMHLADGCIGLSSFAASPSLRSVFPDCTGALRVFCTPSIGSLANPSLRASVLRGMGVGTTADRSARAAGGAGGGENNLVFKVRRKRLAIETMNLDVDGGVKERRTKPPEGVAKPLAPAKPTDAAVSAASSAPTPIEVSPDARPSAPTPLGSFGGLRSLRARGLQARKASPHTLHTKDEYEF